MVKYKIVSEDEVTVLTAFVNGNLYVVDSSHPNFDKILKGVLEDDINEDLFDLSVAVQNKFQPLSERVSVLGGQVYFDGDQIDGAVTRQIVRFLDEGHSFEPLVNFLEKVSANPEPHSREQLYVWLENHDITIASDGDILAFKGVNFDGKVYTSTHSGPAIVNGVKVNGYVPQVVGDTVEMPRSTVTHDPSNACSSGLHVGTHSYAAGFGAHKLTVRVNPRDVVSVPTDGGGAKIRVCRYKVVDVAPHSDYDSGYVDDYDEDDDTVEMPVVAKANGLVNGFIAMYDKDGVRVCNNRDGNLHHGRGYCRKCYGAKYKR